MSDIERARAFWGMASGFPPDKERVYPQHAIVQRFDCHRGETVVEYGCGGGSDAVSWARRGNRVLAYDVVPVNVLTTEARLRRDASQSDARAILLDGSVPLPLADGCADVVSCHGVLHHIAPPAHEAVMAEFARVLRPGGLLYLMLYTEHLWERTAELRAGYMGVHGCSEEEAFGAFTDAPGCPYARHYTDAQARALVEASGLVVEEATVWNGGDFRTLRAAKPTSRRTRVRTEIP